MATKFLNRYATMKKKEEFWITPDEEELTDQSQLCGASIVEMAKRFGIDAIIAKAEKTVIDNEKLLDTLYGNDYTKMFSSVEETLNVKKKIANMFENVPARLRKEIFNDNIAEFLNAYTINDEKKLTQLNKIGMVSDSQLENVKEFNKQVRLQQAENETKQRFIEELERVKGGIYETFKETGNITINSNNNNSESGGNI